MLQHYFADTGPGAALGVAPNGQAPIIECRGLADIEDGVPITPDTAFDLASASKVFTATAVMLLAERGELRLDAPVYTYLDVFARPEAGRPISVQDLLWHTSGLPDYLAAGLYTPPEEMTRAYVLRQVPQWSAAAVPGRAHAYSNTNYVVLARVVEAVMGRPFSDVIEATLIEPFDLRSTAVNLSSRPDLGIARGYRNLGYGIPSIERTLETGIDTDGDGGVWSSLRDLLRWQHLFWSGEIVGHETLRRMQTPGVLDSGEPFGYGCGLQIEMHGGEVTWCGHGGSWTQSTTLLGRYLEAGIDIVVLSNEFMAPVERIAQRAFADLNC